MIDPPDDSPDRLDPDAAALEELRQVFARAEQPAAEPDDADGGDGFDQFDPDESSDDSWALVIDDEDGREDEAVGVAGPAADGERRSRRRWWRRGSSATIDDTEDADDSLDGAASGGSDPVAIRIIDDELPDAVYLDDDERTGAAVIIDDGTLGELAPGDLPTYTRSSMDPKIRDRRVAVRRALGRRRLRWVVGVAVVLVVALGALGVLTSPIFTIDADRVTVFGAVYTDRTALGEIIDDLVGTPTLTVDSEAFERRIETIPWVLDARVRVVFPRSAVIDIAERKPLVTYQGLDGRFRVIDRQGRVLDVIDGQPIAYLLIETPGAPDLAPGQFATPGVAAAAELAQALTASVRQRAVRIDVAGDGSDLSLFIVGGNGDVGPESGETALVEVVFGSASDILVKLVRLETVLSTALDQQASRVDVSTAEVTFD